MRRLRRANIEPTPGTAESIRFRSRGSTDDDGSLPDGDLGNATGVYNEAAGEYIGVDENGIEEIPL